MVKTDNLGPSLLMAVVVVASAAYGWSWWYILPLVTAWWYYQNIGELFKGARALVKEEQELKNQHLRLQNRKLEVDIGVAELRKDAIREQKRKGSP